MAVRFSPNPAGIARLVLLPGVAADLFERAKLIAETAHRTAPFDPEKTVHYRDHLEVTMVPLGLGVVGRVTATVPYAHKLESEYRILGGALEAAVGS